MYVLFDVQVVVPVLPDTWMVFWERRLTEIKKHAVIKSKILMVGSVRWVWMNGRKSAIQMNFDVS